MRISIEGDVMKVPKKADLYQQIDALEKDNKELREKLEREKRKEWDKLRVEAYEAFNKYTESLFPNSVIKERLYRIDEVGYWFSFELIYDNNRQTYVVRHSDLKEVCT